MIKLYLTTIILIPFILMLLLGLVIKNRTSILSGITEFQQVNNIYNFEFNFKENTNILVVPFKNPGLENEFDHKMSIVSKDNANIKREIIFNGRNVGDPSDFKFQFEPIPSGKYTVSIQNLSEERPYIMYGYNNTPNTLSFISYTRRKSYYESLMIIFGKLSEQITRDVPFFSFLLIALALFSRKVIRSNV